MSDANKKNSDSVKDDAKVVIDDIKVMAEDLLKTVKNVLKEGLLEPINAACGKITELGAIPIGPFPGDEPKSLHLEVELLSDVCHPSNDWTFWAFPKKKCSLDDFRGRAGVSTGTFTKKIKGYDVVFPSVSGIDLNDCISWNLVDPTESITDANLDIALIVSPDSPVNDATGENGGDTLTAQASVNNAHKGLTDIAFEFTTLMGNRELDPEMETIFLMADEQYTHVSSTLIKEITPLCSDEKLARFVPKVIIPTLRAKMAAAGPPSE